MPTMHDETPLMTGGPDARKRGFSFEIYLYLASLI